MSLLELEWTPFDRSICTKALLMEAAMLSPSVTVVQKPGGKAPTISIKCWKAVSAGRQGLCLQISRRGFWPVGILGRTFVKELSCDIQRVDDEQPLTGVKVCQRT